MHDFVCQRVQSTCLITAGGKDKDQEREVLGGRVEGYDERGCISYIGFYDIGYCYHYFCHIQYLVKLVPQNSFCFTSPFIPLPGTIAVLHSPHVGHVT